MMDSQIFLSVLCIGFLFSSFNGFVITSNQKKLLASNAPDVFHDQVWRDSQPQSRTGRRYRSYFTVKAKSKGSATAVGSTSSDKVKEMAAFLSIQLLQKVMAESMKPEGEGTVDLDTVERLTKVLQMSDSQPFGGEPSDEASATTPGVTEHTANSSDVPTTESYSIKDHNLSPPPENTVMKSSEAALSSTTDEHNNVTPEDFQSEMRKVKELKNQVAAPVPATVSSSHQVQEVVRNPLEILQSNIPPLRPESVPRKKPEISEAGTDQQAMSSSEEEANAVKSEDETVKMDISKMSLDTVPPNPDVLKIQKAEELFRRRLLKQRIEYDRKEATRQEGEDIFNLTNEMSLDTVPPNPNVLKIQKAEELFRRRLLKQRIEYDRKQATRQEGEGISNIINETKITAKVTPLIEIDSDQEIENDDCDPLISTPIDGEIQSISAETSEIDTESPGTDFPEQVRSNTKSKGEEGESNDAEPYVLDLANQRSLSLISESRIETIVALRQPKSSDEEIQLAAKYAKMEKLEDRAYLLLRDLGMIDEHQDPQDPSYDHSKDDEYCEQRFLPFL
eukprot:CAMPEP_0197185512 /NCGR_PEP_ID=MMETSP1423-20130617/12086_1 /TAXON_ID=476441 /ORGANISM="Pseudo-nitzschia heimii, Strain UNC1101" /LENGTH=562 /DNA_ID=CAMNT_0042636597 /DNA_START=140 /DNA_END=1828 /DNA_ORIENTATION=-